LAGHSRENEKRKGKEREKKEEGSAKVWRKNFVEKDRGILGHQGKRRRKESTGHGQELVEVKQEKTRSGQQKKETKNRNRVSKGRSGK